MSIRAVKSRYSDNWHVEEEFSCINGLTAWFVIATVESEDESSMGYTDGAFGTAEQRATRIATALSTGMREP